MSICVIVCPLHKWCNLYSVHTFAGVVTERVCAGISAHDFLQKRASKQRRTWLPPKFGAKGRQ